MTVIDKLSVAPGQIDWVAGDGWVAIATGVPMEKFDALVLLVEELVASRIRTR